MADDFIRRSDVMALKKPFPDQKGMITLYREYFISPEAVEQLPSANVRPVVLCKNCEHAQEEAYHNRNKLYRWCGYLSKSVLDDEYCVWGVTTEAVE